jgi:hypothetical protein
VSRGGTRLFLAGAAAGAALLGVRARRHGPPPAAAVAAVLTTASVPVLAADSARRRDPGLVWWLLGAQQLRTATALASYELVYRGVWRDATDLVDYHVAGRRIAELLEQGRLREAERMAQTVSFDTLTRGPRGTNLIRLLNGGLYAAIGPSRRNSFVVFSWLGFWGLYCFYRAFETAVPSGSDRVYRRFLFLSPSLLFWSGNIGKEPWMLLSLGVSALGAARALTPGARRSGLATCALGAAMTVIGRPRVPHTPAAVDDLTRRSSSGGDSRFQPAGMGSPRRAAVTAATVLFRPHPLEAHNRLSQAAAAEGALLFVLTLARLRWIASAVAGAPRQPYIGVAVACIGGLMFVLSGVANFGMLARQRTPMLPFYFVLLSVPPRRVSPR